MISTRGQFLSEDPIFLSSSQNLSDPQSLNAYSYSDDNPITRKDPSGRQVDPSTVVTLLSEVASALNEYLNFLEGPVGQVGVGNAVSQSHVVTDPFSTPQQKAGAIFLTGLSLFPEFSGEEGAGAEAAENITGEGGAAKNVGESASNELGVAISQSSELHIFRDAPGHLPDTPANRELIVTTASNPENFLGTDSYGNDWHASPQPDGTQVWT